MRRPKHCCRECRHYNRCLQKPKKHFCNKAWPNEACSTCRPLKCFEAKLRECKGQGVLFE